jgi:transcriptional regulator with XRE-family HTH domain
MPDVQQPADLTLEQAIGQLLRRFRLARGLKQVEVSAATGFGLRSIRTMEQGKQSMTIRSLDALSLYYRIPLEDLVRQAKELRGGKRQFSE